MKLTLDTLQKNKACVVLTAAWKPCVIKFGFVPITKIKDGIHLLWYPYTPNREKLLRSKLKSLLLCGCLRHFRVPYAKSNSCKGQQMLLLLFSFEHDIFPLIISYRFP